MAANQVLDASALLAAMLDEPGGASVADALDSSAMSAVNWSEVLQKAIGKGVDTNGLRAELESLGLGILPFGADEAELAAKLWPHTQLLGLSLGDRACLALAQKLGVPAVTADRSWTQLELGIDVRVIR